MKNILALIALLIGINTAFAYELREQSYSDLKVGSTIFLEELSKYDKFSFGFNVYKEPDSSSFYLIRLYDGPVKILGYAQKEQMLGITAPWIKIQFKGRDQDYQGYIWAGDLVNNVQLMPSINMSFVIDMDDNNMNVLAIAGTGENEGQIVGKIAENMDGKNIVLLQRISPLESFDFAPTVLEVTSSHSAYTFAEYTYYYAWINDHFAKLLTTTNEGLGECGEYLEKISSAPHGLLIKTIQFYADSCDENSAPQKPLFNVIVYQWDDRQEQFIEQKQTTELIKLDNPKMH